MQTQALLLIHQMSKVIQVFYFVGNCSSHTLKISIVSIFDDRKAPYFSRGVKDVLRRTNLHKLCQCKMQIGSYHRSDKLWLN